MCGIFGFAGKSSWRSSALLQALCIEDEIRGKDSTGFVINNPERSWVKKKAVRGRKFVSLGFTELLFHNAYDFALGHNRFATTGAVNDRNAHPFGVQVQGKWNFGIHNGIVGAKEEIAREFEVKEPEVDSEVVFRAIAKMQNQNLDVIDAIEEVTGFISESADFAFAYLNNGERALYLWRSPDRPLFIMDARRLGLGRWFCSTREIFLDAWACLRGALGNIEKVTCFSAIPYRLYRVKADGIFELDPVKELRHRPRFIDPEEPVIGCKGNQNRYFNNRLAEGRLF